MRRQIVIPLNYKETRDQKSVEDEIMIDSLEDTNTISVNLPPNILYRSIRVCGNFFMLSGDLPLYESGGLDRVGPESYLFDTSFEVDISFGGNKVVEDRVEPYMFNSYSSSAYRKTTQHTSLQEYYGLLNKTKADSYTAGSSLNTPSLNFEPDWELENISPKEQIKMFDKLKTPLPLCFCDNIIDLGLFNMINESDDDREENISYQKPRLQKLMNSIPKTNDRLNKLISGVYTLDPYMNSNVKKYGGINTSEAQAIVRININTKNLYYSQTPRRGPGPTNPSCYWEDFYLLCDVEDDPKNNPDTEKIYVRYGQATKNIVGDTDDRKNFNLEFRDVDTVNALSSYTCRYVYDYYLFNVLACISDHASFHVPFSVLKKDDKIKNPRFYKDKNMNNIKGIKARNININGLVNTALEDDKPGLGKEYGDQSLTESTEHLKGFNISLYNSLIAKIPNTFQINNVITPLANDSFLEKGIPPYEANNTTVTKSTGNRTRKLKHMGVQYNDNRDEKYKSTPDVYDFTKRDEGDNKFFWEYDPVEYEEKSTIKISYIGKKNY